MKRLIGYCRVSTANQREEGTIDIQRTALKEYAAKNEIELVDILCDDGVSGGKELENRPGLSALFERLEGDATIDGILIFKLDRLARDLYIQEHLIRKMQALGRHILSLKEPDLDSNDPMRKAFRQFMGIVSELEKSFITMRLSGGRVNKARRGGYAGGCPAMGYTAKDKALAADTVAAGIVKQVFDMHKSGAGLREIARRLNEQNTPTARGGKWYAATVRYIINNPLYRGVIEYAGETFTDTRLALV